MKTMQIMEENFVNEETIDQELTRITRDIKAPNIAVIGKTGAGKSTLINQVFGIQEAITGAGLPVTKAFKRYPSSLDAIYPIIIYDSAGYEVGKESEFVKSIFAFLEEKKLEVLKIKFIAYGT